MTWLTGHRILRAADGDSGKATMFFGFFVGALVMTAVIIGLLDRAGASTARGLLAFLEDNYPGQAYAVFKSEGLKEDVSKLAPSPQAGTWHARTMYAALTVDAKFITLWDGSRDKATMVARIERTAVTAVKAASEPLQIRTAPALALTIQQAPMPLQITVSPAAVGNLIFLPVSDLSSLRAAILN
ncbi:hypothetical protein E3O42_10465 [Cryobacterium adonitolivorans]|uniref:Uncharacterized protein n=1 Tax=Cryobacterium adonitolivorans TaxID=1259189 RepID=A0A4R8W6H8_9MICO|nr:hypothetical protein [Cryobacterium adonitolivorans]TFC01525.1 hypothetical protein E3O42_10465 [Cryobacterium adonitolivorans]